MVTRREKLPPSTLDLSPTRHSKLSLEEILEEVSSVMSLTPDATPMSLFDLKSAHKNPEETTDASEASVAVNSALKKRFTVIEPAVFLIYVATSLASKRIFLGNCSCLRKL